MHASIDILNEARERIRLCEVVDLSLRLVEDSPVKRTLFAIDVGIAYGFFLEVKNESNRSKENII